MTENVGQGQRQDADAVAASGLVFTRAICGRVPSNYMVVGLVLASYQEQHGSDYALNVAQLAADVKVSRNIILRSLRWLGENGWISIGKRDAQRMSENFTYQLTVSFEVAADLGFVESA